MIKNKVGAVMFDDNVYKVARESTNI